MSKTNTASNALLQYESGQEVSAMGTMVDSGDHITFSVTDVDRWSQRSGFEPNIKPDGLASGGVVTPGATNDTVSVAALTCYLAGILTSVGANAALSVARPAASPAGLKGIRSITVNSSGALAVVAGTDNASLSATRAAAGGPPLIPAGSIEIAQVKYTSSTSAIVGTAEIFQVPGASQEKYDYPVWDEDSTNGTISFASALPTTHAGSPATCKGVYAEVYEPVFSDLEPASDFVAPETSHSVSSTPVYGGAIAAASTSLGQGSFKAYLRDGVTDPIVKLKGENLFFKHFPDRNKTPYVICQGKLGISRKWPAGDNIVADCTISAEVEATEVES